MRTEIQKFEYQAQSIRIRVDNSGGIWFVLNDVYKILGYTNLNVPILKLDEDDYMIDLLPNTHGQLKTTYLIDEFGIYALIFYSTKTEAKAFKRWVYEIITYTRLKLKEEKSNH